MPLGSVGAISQGAGVIAALSAAFCWTVASLIWRRLPTSLTATRLNLLKNLLALALQGPLLLLAWGTARPDGGLAPEVLLLAASGIIGIALGDSLHFAALRRLGTRRTLTIASAAPALTTLVGIGLLGETPRPAQWPGIALISLSVLLVSRRDPVPAAPGSVRLDVLGLVLAFSALVCNCGGALLSRAALRTGTLGPLEASTLRLTAAALVMLPLLRGMPRPGCLPRPARPRWPMLLVATLLGTSLGLWLQQAALAGLQGGIAVALISTSPVMALLFAPLEGDRPGWRGGLAACSVVGGVSLVIRPAGGSWF